MVEWQHWLILALVIGVLVQTVSSAWRRLKSSEKMLQDVDKSKLKNLDNDGWDGD